MDNPKDLTVTTGPRRNLRLFVAYRLGISLLPFAPVSLFFYQEELGFGLTAIGALYAVTMLSYLVFDTQFGFFADTVGYRVILIMGVAIQAGCYWVLAFTHQQWLVWVILVVLGIGQAAVTGPEIALGRIGAKVAKVNFDNYLRYSIAFAAAGECVAGIIASILLSQWPEDGARLGVIVQAVLYTLLVAVPAAMGEKRVRAGVRRNVRLNVAVLVKRFVGAIRHELRVKATKWLVIYSSLIGCMLQTSSVTLVLPYLQEVHVEKGMIGLLWAGFNVLWAVCTLFSGVYERKLGRWGAIVSLTVWAVLLNGLMVVLGGVWGIAALAAFYFMRSICLPLLQSSIQGAARTYPATLFSLAGSTQVIMYGAMNPILGYVSEHVSVRAAFGVSVVVYGVLGGICLWCWQRVRSE